MDIDMIWIYIQAIEADIDMILYPKVPRDMGYDMISQNLGYLPILEAPIIVFVEPFNIPISGQSMEANPSLLYIGC